jgi:hypothetical protein
MREGVYEREASKDSDGYKWLKALLGGFMGYIGRELLFEDKRRG